MNINNLVYYSFRGCKKNHISLASYFDISSGSFRFRYAKFRDDSPVTHRPCK